MISEGSFDDVV